MYAPCFPAQVVGARVRRTGSGSVHSVFARALNLSGDHAWVALQSPELPPTAHCIGVAWPFRDLRMHFASGSPWRWDGEHLVLALRDCRQIRVSTRRAAAWTSPMLKQAGHVNTIAGDGSALWRQCARTARGRSVFWSGAHDGHTVMPMRRARHALRRLRQARDADDIDAAVRALIGLGPGLTPAGDDAVIGWLAGMALLPADPVRDALVQAARRSIAGCLARTTEVSRAHLEDALAGQFAHSLSLFANAFLEARALERVPRALAALADCGATSGLDAAAGLLAAVSTATRPARAAGHDRSG